MTVADRLPRQVGVLLGEWGCWQKDFNRRGKNIHVGGESRYPSFHQQLGTNTITGRAQEQQCPEGISILRRDQGPYYNFCPYRGEDFTERSYSPTRNIADQFISFAVFR